MVMLLLIVAQNSYAEKVEELRLTGAHWEEKESRLIEHRGRSELYVYPPVVIRNQGMRIHYSLCYSKAGFVVTPVTINDSALAAVPGNMSLITGQTKRHVGNQRCNGRSGSILIPKLYIAKIGWHSKAVDIVFHGPRFNKTLKLLIHAASIRM
jgi:hypothetical protein